MDSGEVIQEEAQNIGKYQENVSASFFSILVWYRSRRRKLLKTPSSPFFPTRFQLNHSISLFSCCVFLKNIFGHTTTLLNTQTHKCMQKRSGNAPKLQVIRLPPRLVAAPLLAPHLVLPHYLLTSACRSSPSGYCLQLLNKLKITKKRKKLVYSGTQTKCVHVWNNREVYSGVPSLQPRAALSAAGLVLMFSLLNDELFFKLAKLQ